MAVTDAQESSVPCATVKGGNTFLARLLFALAGAVILVAASATMATASAVLGDRNVRSPQLAVGARGVAVVSYTTEAGADRHVLAWGAVNARAHPTGGAEPQVAFRLDYSGGWKSHGDAGRWRRVRNACTRYTGPALPFFVAGCDAPDGSYWALQRWQRNLPMRGFAPWTAAQRASELHLSHWSGHLPVLEIYRHWSYGGDQQGFFGRLTYAGEPVYGTRSSSATVADTWARNVYIDAFESDYGPGWQHDTAIATHSGNGGFCYSFVPQAPPSGYPSSRPHGRGLGERYRVSVMGPGVTPVVQWEGSRLGAYDAGANSEATRTFDTLLGGDRHCAPER